MRAHPAEAYSYRADASVPSFADDRALLLVDGTCVLCSAWAAFVIRHDPRARIRLATAQSPLGRALYGHYRLDADATNLLLAGGRAYAKSEAVLGALETMGPPWSAFAAGRLLPRSWRDKAYDLLARNRFRLFGRREVCLVPSPSTADRFLA